MLKTSCYSIFCSIVVWCFADTSSCAQHPDAYNGFTLSAGIPIPYDTGVIAQADLRWRQYRLSYGRSLGRRGVDEKFYKEQSSYDGFHVEFAYLPWGYNGGQKNPCPNPDGNKKMLEKRKPVAFAPILGLGYQKMGVQGTDTTIIRDQINARNYQYQLKTPYLHTGLEFFIGSFYLMGGTRLGAEIPYNQEGINILNPQEQEWGFRIYNLWYARVGWTIFLHRKYRPK
jgi:hypothetical protein